MKWTHKYLMILSLFCSFHAAGQEIPRWKLADLKNTIQQADHPLILNFWATFCKPCLEELPYFQELASQYKTNGVELILVSLDLPEDFSKIRSFAEKHHINATIVYLDETDADMFCPAVDSDWSGSIPATLFLNNKNHYKRFYEAKMSKENLEKEINLMMQHQ